MVEEFTGYKWIKYVVLLTKLMGAELPVCHLSFMNRLFRNDVDWDQVMLHEEVCLFYSGFTSLSTIFQSYRDGVWM